MGKSELFTSSWGGWLQCVRWQCSTWNNRSKINLKRCGKKWTIHVEMRWLAAVCQMKMFHVEQSIQNHFKVLWGKKSERFTSSWGGWLQSVRWQCSTWNNQSKITLKCCGKKWTIHVELRWLAAECQMTMFHVEQSIQNHLKVLWEKVNGSRRVEVVGSSVSDDNVPRGTINPKSP